MWKKIINQDEEVELELSKAEHKLLLTGLVYRNKRVEEEIDQRRPVCRGRSASAIWMTWPGTSRAKRITPRPRGRRRSWAVFSRVSRSCSLSMPSNKAQQPSS